eukprot:353741-Chlamydomonas_euryale.AAC.3
MCRALPDAQVLAAVASALLAEVPTPTCDADACGRSSRGGGNVTWSCVASAAPRALGTLADVEVGPPPLAVTAHVESQLVPAVVAGLPGHVLLDSAEELL